MCRPQQTIQPQAKLKKIWKFPFQLQQRHQKFDQQFVKDQLWQCFWVMLETMSIDNKHSLLLSDLSHDKMLSKSTPEEASRVCVTLGAGLKWCSWCGPLQLGYPRGKRIIFSLSSIRLEGNYVGGPAVKPNKPQSLTNMPLSVIFEQIFFVIGLLLPVELLHSTKS